MARDSQSKLSSKEQSKRFKKQDAVTRKKKIIQQSDSDENSESNSESDSDDNLDPHEYRKLLSQIFPSKHITRKVAAGEKVKKIIEEDYAKQKKSKKSKKEDSSSEEYFDEDEEEEEEDSSDESWETDEEVVESKKKSSKQKKSKKSDDAEDEGSKRDVNIILTIGNNEDEWYDDEDDSDYDDDEDGTEDEDEEVSSDDSQEENSSCDEDTFKEDDESLSPKKKKTVVNKSKAKLIVEEDKSDETFEQLKKMLELKPNDKSIQKCIAAYKKDLKEQTTKKENKSKKQKAKNMRIFKKILKDKNTTNDFSFYEKLDTEHQTKIIKELREINKITRIEKPYRMTLLESSIPVEFKSAAMKKINSLRYMEPGSGDFYKNKNWVDTFMRIPFNKYEGLPISINDGVDKCHDFMEKAQKTLDDAVYGLNDAKMQIMQMLGQLLTNPQAIGAAIAIHGPPGTGKTSLVKEGISKILNRPFTFIALGGATDSSFLEGHGYTYEGSTWGKIIQILIESKCMNPVIYFDELDKISDTPRGEEIIGILTHLTDTSQNSQFHDKYFAEINFDLSKCLFIFSYNDETKVNSILKDRMYRIKTKGYVSKEKTIIANDYLLPKIREQVRFSVDEIIISNDVISHIIDNHCNKEDGVRNLKRCLEIVHTKLNLYRLMKPGSNLFEGEMALKVTFPYTVTKAIIDKLIKRETDGLETWRSLYV
jgi:ATP-dependent Lon protease